MGKLKFGLSKTIHNGGQFNQVSQTQLENTVKEIDDKASVILGKAN